MHKTTILIPTYNRPHHLQRLIAYYRSRGFCGQILVLDSSLDNLRLDERNFVGEVRLINYCSDISLLNKVADGITHVETPYLQLCADDDFIDTDGIAACQEFMDSAPDYSAAQGRCIHFSIAIERGHAQPKLIRDEPLVSLDDDDPVKRLFAHLTDYRPTHYALQRLDQVKTNYATCMKLDDPSDQTREISPSIKCTLMGKVKRIDIAYEFRENHANRICYTILSWVDLVTSEDWRRQYLILEDFITEEFVALGKNGDAARHWAKLAIQEWLRLCMKKYFIRKAEVRRILEKPTLYEATLSERIRRMPWTAASMIRMFVNARLASKENVLPGPILDAIRSNAHEIYAAPPG